MEGSSIPEGGGRSAGCHPGVGRPPFPSPGRPASSPRCPAPPVLSAVRAGRRAGLEHDRSPLRSRIASNINDLACRISSIMETQQMRHARLRAVWAGSLAILMRYYHLTFVSGFRTVRGKRNRIPARLTACLCNALVPGAQVAHCANQATGAAPGSFHPISTACAVRRDVLPALRTRPNSIPAAYPARRQCPSAKPSISGMWGAGPAQTRFSV